MSKKQIKLSLLLSIIGSLVAILNLIADDKLHLVDISLRILQVLLIQIRLPLFLLILIISGLAWLIFVVIQSFLEIKLLKQKLKEIFTQSLKEKDQPYKNWLRR